MGLLFHVKTWKVSEVLSFLAIYKLILANTNFFFFFQIFISDLCSYRVVRFSTRASTLFREGNVLISRGCLIGYAKLLIIPYYTRK